MTFEKEQIVVWRGKDYKPVEDGFLLPDREMFDDTHDDIGQVVDENDTKDDLQGPQDFDSGEE